MIITQDSLINQIADREDISVATVRNIFNSAEDIVFDHLSSTPPSENIVIKLKEKYPNKAKSVPGNCDGLFGDGIIDIDGVKVFYTHGHDYGVKSDLTKLYFKAKSLGVNVVLFGHTHEKLILEKDGILFINPGSVRDGMTYAYLVISNKKAYAKIVDIY